jgi:hypothetical protein
MLKLRQVYCPLSFLAIYIYKEGPSHPW